MKLMLIATIFLLSSHPGIAKNMRNVLKSQGELLKYYKEFKEAKNIQFEQGQERLRFKLFREAAEQVAHLNEDENEEAEYEMNAFSVMTEEEKGAFLGLNISLTMSDEVEELPRLTRTRRAAIPESKNWIAEGYVIEPQDQANCGSCWAFAAIASFEGEYKKTTGILRKFSEQEFLDCTYENKKWNNYTYNGEIMEEVYKNGCGGGWFQDSYIYVRDHGHLASAKDYPYHATDCKCRREVTRNSMVGASVVGRGYLRLPKGEDGVIEALAEHVLNMAFMVTKNFYPYKRGIWKDEACKESPSPNHGVAFVGYTPTYALVKNSWGKDWGDHGFVRFKRNHDHCYVWNYVNYALLGQTGVVDQLEVAEPSTFDPTLTDPHPDCDQFVNTRDDCDLDTCETEDKDGTYWTVECKRTCNNCGHIGPHTGECPAGTVRCGGVCKHKHMC